VGPPAGQVGLIHNHGLGITAGWRSGGVHAVRRAHTMEGEQHPGTVDVATTPYARRARNSGQHQRGAVSRLVSSICPRRYSGETIAPLPCRTVFAAAGEHPCQGGSSLPVSSAAP